MYRKNKIIWIRNVNFIIINPWKLIIIRKYKRREIFRRYIKILIIIELKNELNKKIVLRKSLIFRRIKYWFRWN